MKLSTNFTLEEFTSSATANRLKISNQPSAPQIENLKALVANVLQPLREKAGCPIVVSSGFRSAALNKAVGSAVASQHLAGEAADIIITNRGTKNRAAIRRLLGVILASDTNFDQCIAEKCDSLGRPSWIHISYKRSGSNRSQVIYSR